MKLFHRLFGGRGIRSFSFWLVLWGLVSVVLSFLYPFGCCIDYPEWINVFHLSSLFNPLSIFLYSPLPSSTPEWIPPLFSPLAWYVLGRCMDGWFLKKCRKKGGS